MGMRPVVMVAVVVGGLGCVAMVMRWREAVLSMVKLTGEGKVREVSPTSNCEVTTYNRSAVATRNVNSSAARRHFELEN